MFCPNCGSEVPEGNAFCEECGEKIQSEGQQTEVLDELPAEEPSSDKVESFAAGLTPEEESFLANQGIIAPEEGGVIPEGDPERRTPKWVVAVLFAALVVVAACAGFFITKYIDHRSDDAVATTTATESANEKGSSETKSATESPEAGKKENAAKHLIAGRGTMGYNDSLDGYRAWVDDGAKMIEQDVRVSAEGTLYVAYEDKSIEGKPDAQIGYTRLADVFDAFEIDDSVIFVVEMKSTSNTAIEALAKLIKEHGYQDRVMVQSFDASVLERVHGEFPDMELMCLINGNYNASGRLTLDEALGKDYIDVIAVSEDTGLQTGDTCRRVKDAKKKFGAFILNDRESVINAISIGTDYYFIGDGVKPSEAIQCEMDYRKE